MAIVDAVGGDADDAVAMWKVRAARETAWTNAEVLWALRTKPVLRDAFFSRLDSFTGFAGRGLLLRPGVAPPRDWAAERCGMPVLTDSGPAPELPPSRGRYRGARG